MDEPFLCIRCGVSDPFRCECGNRPSQPFFYLYAEQQNELL